MTSGSRIRCPLCGNDRIVRVTRFVEGETDLQRAVCTGALGCDAWFDPATQQPTAKGWDEVLDKSERMRKRA